MIYRNLLCLFLVVFPYIKDLSQTFRSGFDNYESGAGGAFGQGYSYDINVLYQGGFLLNAEAIYMDSYLMMFKATKDKRYLDKFIIHSKRVQERRDDNITMLSFNQLEGFPALFYDENGNFVCQINGVSQISQNNKALSDSIKSKAISLEASPLFIFTKNENKGKGWMSSAEFIWNNKRNVSLSTGFSYIDVQYRSPLFDSLHYSLLGVDPANGYQPECKNCRIESESRWFLLKFDLYYTFNIQKFALVVGGGLKTGLSKTITSIADINNNIIAYNVPYNYQDKSDHIDFSFLTNFFVGMDTKICKRIYFGLYAYYESFFYYLPFASGIKVNMKYYLQKH